jgi:ATP-dependent Clp protease adaptor protein ClpS
MAKTDVKVKIKPNLKLSEPSLFKVLYMNDNVTTMEFVVHSLVDYFNHSIEGAVELTKNIHNSGSAIVAVLPYEIAEQKSIEVTLEARSQSYPLQVTIESETA